MPETSTLRTSAMQVAPRGLGKAGAFTPHLPHHVPAVLRKRSVRRRRNHVQTQAFFPLMEVSVNVLDTVDMMRSTVSEEVVLEATLQVPAHHAIACRVEAYSTPFASPDLQTSDPSQLSEDDKQYAACLAAPPDLEVVHSMTFKSMGSILGMRHAPSLLAREELVAALQSDHNFQQERRNSRQAQPSRGSLEGEEDLPRTASAIAAQLGVGAGELNTLQRLQALQRQPAAAAAVLLGQQRSAGAPSGSAADSSSSGSVPTAYEVPADGASELQNSPQQQQQQQQPVSYTSDVTSRHDSIVIRHAVPASVVRQLGDKLVTTMLGTAYLLVHTFQRHHAPASNLVRTYTRAMTGLHGPLELLRDQAIPPSQRTGKQQQQQSQQAAGPHANLHTSSSSKAGGYHHQQLPLLQPAWASDVGRGVSDQGAGSAVPPVGWGMTRSFTLRPGAWL